MRNEFFIACGTIGSIAVLSSLGGYLLLKRDGSTFRRVWSVCFVILLALVAIYSWRAIASYYEGPRKGGALNPGGPSGYIIQDLFVLATSVVAVPAAYVGLLLLSLFPPEGIEDVTARRIRVYGTSAVVIAAIAALSYQAAGAADVQEERDASLERRMKMFNEK